MTNSRTIQEHLVKVTDASEQGARQPDEQLVFDPESGQLRLMEPGSTPPNPDAVVADQIAEEGFF